MWVWGAERASEQVPWASLYVAFAALVPAALGVAPGTRLANTLSPVRGGRPAIARCAGDPLSGLNEAPVQEVGAREYK